MNYCWFYLLFIVFMNNIVFSYRTSVECFISWRMICHQEVKKYMYNIFIVLMMLIMIVIIFFVDYNFKVMIVMVYISSLYTLLLMIKLSSFIYLIHTLSLLSVGYIPRTGFYCMSIEALCKHGMLRWWW